MELHYFSVFCIQTQTHAVSWNIAKLYELFTTSEMLLLAIYSPFKKKHLNFVTGDGDLANGDTAFSYDCIAVQ